MANANPELLLESAMCTGSGVLFDEKMHRIIVDYDASRLKEGNITFLLRNAGIRLRNTIGKAAA